MKCLDSDYFLTTLILITFFELSAASSGPCWHKVFFLQWMQFVLGVGGGELGVWPGSVSGGAVSFRASSAEQLWQECQLRYLRLGGQSISRTPRGCRLAAPQPRYSNWWICEQEVASWSPADLIWPEEVFTEWVQRPSGRTNPPERRRWKSSTRQELWRRRGKLSCQRRRTNQPFSGQTRKSNLKAALSWHDQTWLFQSPVNMTE